MSSFWIVKDGLPIKHVGRPTAVENTSFALGCTDADYRAAGLYEHVDWVGTYDPRIHEISTPRFVVNETKKTVEVEYTVTLKSVEQVAAYDAEIVNAEADRIKIIGKIAVYGDDGEAAPSQKGIADLPDLPKPKAKNDFLVAMGNPLVWTVMPLEDAKKLLIA